MAPTQQPALTREQQQAIAKARARARVSAGVNPAAGGEPSTAPARQPTPGLNNSRVTELYNQPSLTDPSQQRSSRAAPPVSLQPTNPLASISDELGSIIRGESQNEGARLLESAGNKFRMKTPGGAQSWGASDEPDIIGGLGDLAGAANYGVRDWWRNNDDKSKAETVAKIGMEVTGAPAIARFADNVGQKTGNEFLQDQTGLFKTDETYSPENEIQNYILNAGSWSTRNAVGGLVNPRGKAPSFGPQLPGMRQAFAKPSWGEIAPAVADVGTNMTMGLSDVAGASIRGVGRLAEGLRPKPGANLPPINQTGAPVQPSAAGGPPIQPPAPVAQAAVPQLAPAVAPSVAVQSNLPNGFFQSIAGDGYKHKAGYSPNVGVAIQSNTPSAQTTSYIRKDGGYGDARELNYVDESSLQDVWHPSNDAAKAEAVDLLNRMGGEADNARYKAMQDRLKKVVADDQAGTYAPESPASSAAPVVQPTAPQAPPRPTQPGPSGTGQQPNAGNAAPAAGAAPAAAAQPVTTPPVGQVSRDYAGLHPKVRAAVNRLLENSGVEPQRIPAIIANLDQLPPDKSEMVVTELIRKFGAGDPKLETNIEKVGRDFTVNTPTGKGDNAQAVVRGNIRRMLDEQGPLLEKAASDRFGPGAVATNEAIEAEVNQIRSVYRRILDPDKPYGNITSPAKRKEIDAAREDLKSYLKGPDVAASIPNWVRQDAINTLNRDLRAGGYQPIQKSGMTDFEWAEIVDAYPTQIAHSLQSSFATAGREASKSTDMQGKALARDLSEKRVGLLYLLEKSVDKYRDTRVKFGHEMGARDALTLPERFLSIADDEVKLGQLLDDLDELTPAQFDAAKSQITTVVRNAMGKKIENASLAEVGAGDRGVSTPNLTQLSKRGVLEALEKAFGADGKKLADDIRLSRAKTNMLTKIEPDFGPRSASNIQDAANAPRLYEDPTATGANVIDQAGATLGGLGLGLGAMGNIPAAAGVLSLAGARAIWQAIKNGRKLSPEQRTQFAQFLFALRRGEAEAPRLEGPDAPPPSGPPPITGPKGPPKISSPAASRPPEKMGFGGSKQPIPMDEGARMGRAREQGDARVSPMDDEVAAILDSRPDAPDAELAKLWDDKIRAGTINPKDVPALVTRYRERHARNSVDFFIQNIIDKDRAAHQNPSELLGRISERLRQLGEMEPDKFLKREIEQRRRAIINGQNPLDPSQSGSSKLLAGMGASPEAVGGIGGAAAGYFGNPTDANQDGVIDDKDRGLNAMGGLMSGVVGGNIAKRGVNAMRNITPPKGPPTGPVQATFGGRRGAGTLAAKGEKRPQQALDMAEQMAAKGASRDEIWDATSKQLEGSPFAGAFKGKDGQWRFEIDDSGAEVIRPARRAVVDFTRLSDRMTDADAGGAYPPLADMTADFRHAKQEIGSAHEELGFRRDPDNPRWMIAVGGKDAAAQRSIALHERQHIIQQNEGFTTGASPDDFIPKDKQGKFAPFTQVGAYRNYRKTAGEVEARNVQKRADMTPAERRATPPWKTQDTPDKDQIARFGSGKQESRPPVSNGLAGKGPPPAGQNTYKQLSAQADEAWKNGKWELANDLQRQANALKAGPPQK